MPKVIKKSNFRVVVTPKNLGDFGSIRMSETALYNGQKAIQKGYENRCDEIIEQIKRHVDYVGDVEVECDTAEVCGHCGREWEVEETGEPLCCNEAVKEWEASKETVVKQ